MIAYGIALGQVYREAHALGDIVRMSESAAVLATYFRNNILHLFALPSLLACVFLSNAQVSTGDLQRLAGRIYPYIAQELFLRWEEAELPRVIEAVLAVLAAHGLIEAQPAVDGWSRAGARLGGRPRSFRCWRRPPCRRSSAITWSWRSWCRPAAVPSIRPRSRSAASSPRSA